MSTLGSLLVAALIVAVAWLAIGQWSSGLALAIEHDARLSAEHQRDANATLVALYKPTPAPYAPYCWEYHVCR